MPRDIGLSHPVSDLAMPPILPHETANAEIALCPAHGSTLTSHNVPGKTYFCPLGGMVWRASKGGYGMHSRLTWPKNL